MKINNYDFLIQIAKGFNPITGERFQEDDILLKPEVSARLFELAYDLQKDDKEILTKTKNEFQYTNEINNTINVAESTKLGELYSKISKAIESKTNVLIFTTQSIAKKINNYLVKQGIIETVKTSKNGVKYIATDYGKDFGFSVKLEPEKTEIDRSVIYCSEQAQKFILSKLTEIFNNAI